MDRSKWRSVVGSRYLPRRDTHDMRDREFYCKSEFEFAFSPDEMRAHEVSRSRVNTNCLTINNTLYLLDYILSANF